MILCRFPASAAADATRWREKGGGGGRRKKPEVSWGGKNRILKTKYKKSKSNLTFLVLIIKDSMKINIILERKL